MKKQFLTGNFLPAYAKAYRFKKGYGVPEQKADAEWLEDKLATRTKVRAIRRQNYILTLQVAFVIALLAVGAVFQLDMQKEETPFLTAFEQEIVELQEIVQTAQEVLPPPPPRPPVPIVVADDEILEEDALDFDASLDLTAAAALPPPPIEPVMAEEEQEPEVFVIVEERPEIIGGVAALARAVKYPTIARQAGIEGMVVVKIIISAEGEPRDPAVLRSPSEVLNKAAVDAVMKQRFTPGRQRGRAVAVEMSIPVVFRLTTGA